jgi:hypothetical protein
MIDCLELARIVRVEEPAAQEEIERAQEATGHTFPAEYVELLKCSDGLVMVLDTGIWLNFYSTYYLAERNADYEVSIYLPLWLMIGDDGGGNGIFLDCSSPDGAIYLLGMGVGEYDASTFLSPRLSEWIADGFDLRRSPRYDYDHPEFIDVWLVHLPTGGAKDLLRLKKHLYMDTSIGEMYRALEMLPYRLLCGVPFWKYATLCAEYNQSDDCLRLFEVDQPERPVPFPPDLSLPNKG